MIHSTSRSAWNKKKSIHMSGTSGEFMRNCKQTEKSGRWKMKIGYAIVFSRMRPVCCPTMSTYGQKITETNLTNNTVLSKKQRNHSSLPIFFLHTGLLACLGISKINGDSARWPKCSNQIILHNWHIWLGINRLKIIYIALFQWKASSQSHSLQFTCRGNIHP